MTITATILPVAWVKSPASSSMSPSLQKLPPSCKPWTSLWNPLQSWQLIIIMITRKATWGWGKCSQTCMFWAAPQTTYQVPLKASIMVKWSNSTIYASHAITLHATPVDTCSTALSQSRVPLRVRSTWSRNSSKDIRFPDLSIDVSLQETQSLPMDAVFSWRAIHNKWWQIWPW